MAPTKRIRTYVNNKKKIISESGLALNTLLAENIRKRFETSNNTLGSPRERTIETTFDCLLKGQFYNNVNVRKFPDSCPTDDEGKNTTIFSSESTNENKTGEIDRSLLKSSQSIYSPRVIIQRETDYSFCSQRNKKSESQQDNITIESTRNDTSAAVDFTRNESDIQLQGCGKMELMNSLHLLKNESFYTKFQTSVNEISTPQGVRKTYYLRNPGTLGDDLKNSSNHLSHRTKWGSKRNLNSPSDFNNENNVSMNRSNYIQGTFSKESESYNIEDSHKGNEIRGVLCSSVFEVEQSIGSPKISSTPVKHTKSQDLSSSSFLSKSYGLIHEWSNRPPSLNTFNNQHSKINHKKRFIGSEYLLRRKNDSKLLKKSQVLLKHIPELEDIVRDASRCSTPVDLKFFNVKKVSNNFVTKRKVNGMRNKSPPKNCLVHLTPPKLSKTRTSVESSGCINNQSKKTRYSHKLKFNTSQRNSITKQKICHKLYDTNMPIESSTENIFEISAGGEKHKCSLECEHFRKVPKVVLEKLVFPNNKFTKKSHTPNSKMDVPNLASIDDSPSPFHGFRSNARCSIVNDIENCFNQKNNTVRKSFYLEKNSEPNSPLNKDKIKIKDCYVILERKKDTSILNRSEPHLNLQETNLERNLSNCYVVINESEQFSGRSSCRESYVLEEANVTPTRSEFVSLEPGKKFRRSVAIFKKKLDLVNCSGSGNPVCRISRRQSVKLIPVSPHDDDPTELASFALRNSGYVSLRQSIRRSSLEKVENYLPNVQPVKNYLNCHTKNSSDPVTARDIVLKRCGQTKPLNFEECYPTSALQHCQKIGEGVFGEVFMIRDTDGSTTVMKVIPIEGEQIVNLEKQKTFGEILSEIIISMELSNLRMTKRNNTDAFVKVKRIHCVKGCYPNRLLELWELYDENKESENDSPEMFLDDQLYIVLELANAGQDLEAFLFNNAQQSMAVFEQIACALAVAESELQFEHRDLHWGNVLITLTEEPNSVFVLDGKEIIVKNRGVKATIIDFTLSRIEYEDVIIFNDLALDEDLFTAKGDYQFEIYRKMRENNGNRWQSFKPYSNILWLHYILCKAIDGFRYKNVKSKQHRSSLSTLKTYEAKIMEFDSTTDFVKNNFCDLILID